MTEMDQGFSSLLIEEELEKSKRDSELLKKFYNYLLISEDEKSASEMAYCADYYLRDYVVDFLRLNITSPLPQIVTYFAGNWFITRTLDPEISILVKYLKAIGKLYTYLSENHLISQEELKQINEELSDVSFFEYRIKTFDKVTGDEYLKWLSECKKPLLEGENG